MNKMLLAFALLVAAAPSYAQQATSKEQLIGTWKVLTLKAITTDKVSYPLGEQPDGYVTITPERMWLLFVDSTRKAPAAAALTDAEAIAMMKSQVAWTGKYSVFQTPEGLKLIAHVDAASSQAITGADRVYFMQVIKGDKLMVKSPGVIVPMTGATSVVEFDLVKVE